MKKKYDLIIIGGGASAFAAANKTNKLKLKTLIVNYSKILPIGGTCVNVGCVPSKIMLYQSAKYYYAINNQFKSISLQGDINFIQALNDTSSMIEGFRKQNYEKVIEKQEYVDFLEGFAYFVDKNTIVVNNEKYFGDFFLIASGASLNIPNINGLDSIDYITNKNIFDLKKKPKSIIILGGGPMGVEFAQIFNHFKIKVTLIQKQDNLIPKYEPFQCEKLKEYLSLENIKIYTNTNVLNFEKDKDEVVVTIKEKNQIKKIKAEKIFLATGLKPNILKLKYDEVGIKLDSKGFIKVNDFLQTNIKNIYAVGDVNGIKQLETTAAKEGNIAIGNIFENANKKIDYSLIPSAIFTEPQVASVGMTQKEYEDKYKTCLCKTINLDKVEKALAIRNTKGAIKMVINHKTKVIVGIHIISPLAADIITTATYIIKNKMTIYDVKDTVHIFPTLSEMIKKVAQSFEQDLDEMACCVE